MEFYDIDEKLKVANLPNIWPINKINNKFCNYNLLLARYYLPIHVFKKTKILHTQNFGVASLAVKNGVPVIYEQHNCPKGKYDQDIVKNPLFQVAICQSELMKQKLINNGIPCEKAFWIDNGCSRKFLQRNPGKIKKCRNELLGDKYDKLVVYSGALFAFKGVDLLIDVAKNLKHVKFVITGGTQNQREKYQKIIDCAHLKNVSLLGWVTPRKKLISILQSADILAHPHLSGELANITNPVKLFQYFASGVPVAITGIRPLVRFKKAKLAICWCKPDNVSAFAKCIEQTLKKYPRKEKGYIQNMQFAKQFTWEKRIEKILSFVDEKYRPERIK